MRAQVEAARLQRDLTRQSLADSTGLPLQARLRLKVVQVILDGRLAPGAALPSSRDLAQALGLSRNTVTAVDQQLALRAEQARKGD